MIRNLIIVLGALLQSLFNPTMKMPVSYLEDKNNKDSNFGIGLAGLMLIVIFITIYLLKTYVIESSNPIIEEW